MMSDTIHLIVLDRAQPEEINAIHELIKQRAKGWWHRFTNTWFVGGDTPADQWRDYLKDAITSPGANLLVIKLPGVGSRSWAFSGVDANTKTAWLKKNFGNKR